MTMDPLSFFSPEELVVWASRARTNDWLYLTGLALKLGFLAALLLSGLHVALRDACERVAARLYARPGLARPAAERGFAGRLLAPLERLSDPTGDQPGRWVVDGLYPIALGLAWVVLMLPYSFFGSYVLPHERGLSTITLELWWIDRAKGLLLSTGFYGLLGLGLFGLARRLPRSWWLWLWGALVGMLVVWSLISPYRARIFHSFEPLAPGPTRQAVVELMERAGFELEHVLVVDTSRRSRRAAAYVMGEGPTRRVVLGDNLVAEFPPREIAAALAHELGHEHHRHRGRTWLSLAAGALVFLLLVRLILWRAPRSRRLGLRSGADPAVLPLLLLALLGLFQTGQPLGAWLDRQEEAQADQHALDLTGDPQAFCSLMVRLARTNQAEVDPPAFNQWFWAHHPSVRQRIEAALGWAAQHQPAVGRGAILLPGPDGG